MKTLMKKVGGNGRGCKKARFWNMAQFQTRRWQREHAADAVNELPPAKAINPPLPDSPIPPVNPTPSVPSSEGTQPILDPITTSAMPSFHTPAVPDPQSESCSESAVAPPSVSEDRKNAFIHLRANGWSFRSISQKLGVPKSTLFNWESDHTTRRTIQVMKSLQVERLQEKYLPTFEEELQKLSTCLARIESALEKHDFEKMRPEFLLRTSLQLQTRLNKLRANINPTQTLEHGPSPDQIPGCISRSERIFDSADSQATDPPSSEQCESSESALPQSSEPDLPNPEVWDTNKNSELSQPSTSVTSSGRIGTRVPLSQPPSGNDSAPITSPVTEDRQPNGVDHFERRNSRNPPPEPARSSLPNAGPAR